MSQFQIPQPSIREQECCRADGKSSGDAELAKQFRERKWGNAIGRDDVRDTKEDKAKDRDTICIQKRCMRRRRRDRARGTRNQENGAGRD